MSIDTLFPKLYIIFPLAYLVFWASLINSEPGYALIKSLCSDVDSDLQPSYKRNLAKLLSSFPSKVSENTNKGYYAANTLDANNSETIYALSLCQGDTTLIDCKSCVSNAISNIPTKHFCNNAKSAVLWYDKCMVRYSNRSFLTKVDENVKLGWKNNQIRLPITPSDADKCMILGCDTLFDLAFALSSSKVNYGLLGKGDRKYYATRDVAYNRTVSIYTMAQCTPDLSPADCGRCLRLIINEMTTYCNGSKSVRLLSPSCNTRCEIYHSRKDILSPTSSVDKGSNL